MSKYFFFWHFVSLFSCLIKLSSDLAASTSHSWNYRTIRLSLHETGRSGQLVSPTVDPSHADDNLHYLCSMSWSANLLADKKTATGSLSSDAEKGSDVWLVQQYTSQSEASISKTHKLVYRAGTRRFSKPQEHPAGSLLIPLRNTKSANSYLIPNWVNTW